jgi:Asp-tRNA(Asn)/Glu-tRNA(Gln) amidotransferase A subunit family amidase
MKTFSWSLDTIGLFATSVADVAFVAEAITGRALRVTGEGGAPRLALVRTHLWSEADAAMRDAVERAARRAEAAGATVVDVHLAGVFAEAFAAHQVIQDHEAAWSLAYEHAHHRAALSPILVDTLDAGRAIRPDAYDAARHVAHRARKAALDLFDGFDAVLTPSAPGAAPEGLGSTGSSIFNRLWTLLGMPTVNVPGLVDPRGLPLGLQIVAPFGEDRRALAVAAWLESVVKRAT